jgi:hypothetical protein
MKVTAVTTLSPDRFNYVKVETDEGLTGVGELHPASGTGGTPFVARAAVEYCAEYLVGRNPLHIERHWQHMFRRQLFRGGSDMMAARPGREFGCTPTSAATRPKHWPKRLRRVSKRVLRLCASTRLGLSATLISKKDSDSRP